MSARRANGAARRARDLLLASIALLAAGCSRESAATPALLELERLSFVPAGSVADPGAVFAGEFVGARDALLVDRCEVTRAEWLEYSAGSAESNAPLLDEFASGWGDESRAWPVSFVDHYEASAYAARRGMRLLSAGEWIYCAIGRERRPFPWGYSLQASIANTLELGLQRPAAVGTFEAGRSPQACYDLLGNVAEWVSGGVPGGSPEGGERAAVFGGSFRSRVRQIVDAKPGAGESALFAQELPRTSRADDIGFRCCAVAADYLWQHASEWGSDAAARRRIEATGARWGSSALGVLEALSTRSDAPAALDWLAEGARR